MFDEPFLDRYTTEEYAVLVETLFDEPFLGRYTTEEYAVLVEVLAANELLVEYTVENARLWLSQYYYINPNVNNFMYIPLKEMPLYINDDFVPIKAITQWRLKIAR
jgi:hypothetical protein